MSSDDTHGLGRNPRDLGDDVLDFARGDGPLLLGLGQDALCGARLVDDIDRLVGQMTVVDVARRQLRRRGQRRRSVFDAMMVLEARLQAAQDRHGLVDRGFRHVDLLEAARQGVILLENAAIFGVRGRADAPELAGGQSRLQQVRRIERPARRCAGADQGVNLVDEENRLLVVGQLLQHAFQTLLEIAPVLGPGQQRAHVQRIHGALREDIGHGSFDDATRQAFSNGRFPHARLAYQQRVVLAPAAQSLDHALKLLIASDQGVDLARQRLRVEILRKAVERRSGRRVGSGLGRLIRTGCGLALRRFGDAVGNVVDDVEPRHPLLGQEVHRVRILLAEHRHQHVGAGHFLLAG